MDSFSAERWQRIDELFAEALDLPPAERLEYLAEMCGGDRELFTAVRDLLRREAAAERVIGESATAFAAHLLPSLQAEKDAEEPLPAGGRIGPYRLVREIGRGGMGAVYLAERADEEFERQVAIKLVKRGMDTDEILQRFRYERQILASLQHPNIAALHDGGATEDGRPYLVMELVEGEPITRFCDTRRLDVEARLALFRKVCRAVQHAHESLVVHRDLKPSNILVTASGEPKLLDFGIAKLLDEASSAGAPHTRTGARVLTPEYASPEQIQGGPVTTATDVYALGVVLFQLLSGRRPFERESRTTDGWARRAAGALPDRPSALVDRPLTQGERGIDSLTFSAKEIAAARATTPERLRRRLAGDLDTVALKALAPEPQRRYPSVQALLDDLEHHLHGRPVSARPDTFTYRAGKFLRRHRTAAAAAAAVALSLVGGMSAALWQAEQAAQERDVARHVTTFLEGLFQASDPFAAQPERLDTLRVRELLARGTARVRTELAGQPAVQALEQRLRLHGPLNPDVASSQAGLGMLLRNRGDHARAEPLLRAALATRRTLGGSEDLAVAETMHELAGVLRNGKRFTEAETLLREVLAVRRRLLGESHPELAGTLISLAMVISERGDPAGAEQLHREALALTRATYGAAHPKTATGLLSLASVLGTLERHAEAEPMIGEAIGMYRTPSGPPHPHLASALDMLARGSVAMGRADDAEGPARESLVLRLESFGERHPGSLPGLYTLGSVLQAQGELDAAEALYRDAVAISRDVVRGDRQRAAVPLQHLAGLLRVRGRCNEAEPLFREALALFEDRFPARHPSIVDTRAGLAECLAATGSAGEAAALLRTDRPGPGAWP